MAVRVATKAGNRSGLRLVVAVPITISGEDVHGKAFTESSATVVVNRAGGKIITTHELAAESTIQITVPSRNRVSAARVASLGEKTGNQQEIAIELKHPENFWGIQFPDDPIDWAAMAARRAAALEEKEAEERAMAALAASPAPASPAASAPPAPPATASIAPGKSAPSAGPPAPRAASTAEAAVAAKPRSTADISEIVDQMLASSMQQNLRLAINGLRQELSEQAAEMQSAAVTLVQERVQHAIAAQVEEFELRAVDLLARNEQALEQHVRGFIEGTQKEVEQKLQTLSQDAADAARGDVLEAVFSTKERLQKEADSALKTATESLRHALHQETVQLEKEFAEQCTGRAERVISARVEEASRALSQCARNADEDMAERLARRSEQMAGRFEIEIQRKFARALDEFSTRLEQDLEHTSNHIHQVFSRKVVHELEQHRQELLQQARLASQQFLEQVQHVQRHLGVPMAAPQPTLDQEMLRRTQQALAQLAQDLAQALNPPAPKTKSDK